MKKVVFYFEDGSFKSVFCYGRTDAECISDARQFLTWFEEKEVQSASVFEPLASEY